MYSKTGGKSFKKKPEELLQPQNKAKHSFKVVPSTCGKRLTLETPLAVTCFSFQNPQNLVHMFLLYRLDLSVVLIIFSPLAIQSSREFIQFIENLDGFTARKKTGSLLCSSHWL